MRKQAMWTSSLCLGLSLALFGCAEEPKQVKPTAKPYKGQIQQDTDTPTVENTADRVEEIRRVCNRKAQVSTDISRCWMEESERRGAKKFDVELKIKMVVSPEGKAQELAVLNPTAEFKTLEACVLEAVGGWSFPSGQTMAPAQCNFFLRPIM